VLSAAASQLTTSGFHENLFPATHPGSMLPWEIQMQVLIAKEFLLHTIKSQTGGHTKRDVEKVFLVFLTLAYGGRL
jgi:hypothetical protein